MKGSHKLLRLVAVLGILVVVAAGCSREESGGDAGASGEAKTVKIGFVGPLTGSLASLGLGMKNSIDLAVKQANEAKKIEGWNIVFDPQDDAGKPETGANAANKLASDPDMAGVVGTLQSSISQQVAPVLSRANIAQVSPANTNDTLTRGTDFATSPKRVWPTYFRLATLDSLQGPFGADYAYDQAGFKSVATVHDKLTYGQGLVATFTDQWKKIGGTDHLGQHHRRGRPRLRRPGDQDRQREPRLRLLRRPVPGGGPAVGPAQGPRVQGRGHGRRRHAGRRLHQGRRQRRRPRHPGRGAGVQAARGGQVHRRLRGRRVQGGLRPVRRAVL